MRILHLTDNHISIDDPDPPRTTRMYDAFLQTSDYASKQKTSPKEEFIALLRKAKKEKVDLIALGGDLVNYPSRETVGWVMQQLHDIAGDIPFVYTAGNHDWHEEGVLSDKRYDSARLMHLNSTLRPFYEASATAKSEGPGASHLFGKTSVRGVDVLSVDNSNYQINEEQLGFLQEQLKRDDHKPVVLLLHMPLKLEGTPPLDPKYLCGHPAWGWATDTLSDVEHRPRWPESGNSKSTLAAIDLVRQHSAPAGRIVALLTGHVHKDFSAKLQDGSLPYAANLTALSCDARHPGCHLRAAPGRGASEATGALQYTSLDAAEGGYRMLKVHGAHSGRFVQSASGHVF